MGDFSFQEIARFYPHIAHRPCAGCGHFFELDDRCYADYNHIWHPGCWPHIEFPSMPRRRWCGDPTTTKLDDATVRVAASLLLDQPYAVAAMRRLSAGASPDDEAWLIRA